MNEFTVKKLAEVTAFVDVSQDIIQRSSPTFLEYAPEIARALSQLRMPVIQMSEHGEIFHEKVDKTAQKLTHMTELYVGEEWDNPVEVLEWLSFYAGSASAHAELVSAALAKLGMAAEAEAVKTVASDFWDILTHIKTKLILVGTERATL